MDSLAANPFAFALVAALLWALSSPAISQALRIARTTASPSETVVIGLNLAILVGAALLTAIRGLPDAGLLTEPFVILAGLLTFPVGTGLYYVASVWYRNRAALAAQFANVKPLITIPAGLMFFDETLAGTSVFAAVCITLGIAVIIYGAARKHTSFGAMSFGLFLALSWGIGEVSVRTAAMQSARFDIAHASLVASIPVAIFAWAAIRVMRRGAPIAWPPRQAAAAFVMHGALSFAGAYFFFFASISTHGLSHTVLITTAWPTLAIALSTLWDRDTLRNLSTELMIAMGLFTLGSVVHVAGTAF